MKKNNNYFNYVFGGILAVFGFGLLLYEISIVNGHVRGYHLAPGVTKSEAYMLPFILILVGALFIFFGLRKTKQEKNEEEKIKATAQKQAEAIEEKRRGIRTGDPQLAEEFYRNCVSAGIQDVISSSNVERLTLYAKREQIEGSRDELIAAYKKGEGIANKADREVRIQNIRENEEKKRQESTRYLKYAGREKLIRILKDYIEEEEAIIIECEKQISGIKKGGSTLFQKEHDWAVAGGIATGIAGGAAGLATAIDTQQRNAGIRQNNQAVAGLIYDSISQVNKKKLRAKKNKEKWERLLEKAEVCLIEDRNDKDYLKYVDIVVEEREFSVTGNAIITIVIKPNKPFTIFDDVPAVVDGSIKVCLTSNGKIVGTGYYVFPFYGSGTRSSSYSEKIVCSGDNIPDFFDVRIEANHLWGLEKLDFFK